MEAHRTPRNEVKTGDAHQMQNLTLTHRLINPHHLIEDANLPLSPANPRQPCHSRRASAESNFDIAETNNEIVAKAKNNSKFERWGKREKFLHRLGIDVKAEFFLLLLFRQQYSERATVERSS
jgi:hypothetical protein